MDKYSKKQLPELLFLCAFEIADMIGKNDNIFPEKQTPDDHEKLMHYALVLFQLHDKTHGEKLNNDVFYETIVMFYKKLIANGVYSEDDSIEKAKTADASMNDFLHAHLKFMQHFDNPDSVIQYTSDVFSMIPSCKKHGSFSIPGVTFAALLPEIIETVSKSYDEMIASLDAPHKAPAPPSDDFIIETYPPVPAEPKKKNIALIVCIVALICSLIGNVFLLSGKDEEPTVEKTYWEDAYRDLYFTCSDLAEKVDGIKEEYLFFHQYAVIVSENNSYYHSYDCKTINDSTFWIYNIEYAKYLGHQACPECNPDNHGSMAIRKNLESLIDDAPSKPIGPETAPYSD